MKMIRSLAVAVALALIAAPMAACSTLSPSPFSESLVDEKGLYAAELAYFGAATAVETAVDAGVLTGNRAGQAAIYLQSAYDGLVVAREAQALGNVLMVQRGSAQTLALVADIQRLLRPVPG